MAGVIEEASYGNVAIHDACMTTRGNMDVYTGLSSYMAIANVGKFDVHLPKYQNVGEVADAPVKIDHITDELFSYNSSTPPNNSDSPVDAVYHSSITDRKEQVAKHDSVRMKDEKNQKSLA